MEKLEIIKQLSSLYKKFPKVRKKSATRLAYATLNLTSDERKQLIDALEYCNVKLSKCPTCGSFFEDKCPFCSDPNREKDKILVVSDSKDIYSIENTNSYNGLYYTLNGLLSPLKNQDQEKIGINKLYAKVIDEKIKEVSLILIVEGDKKHREEVIRDLKRIADSYQIKLDVPRLRQMEAWQSYDISTKSIRYEFLEFNDKPALNNIQLNKTNPISSMTAAGISCQILSQKTNIAMKI